MNTTYYVNETEREYLSSFLCKGLNFLIEENNFYKVLTYTGEARYLLSEFIKEKVGEG